MSADSKRGSLRALASEHPVKVGMVADPEPDDASRFHNTDCAVTQADPRRIYPILAFELLELQAGVGGVGLKGTVRSFGLKLDIGRQLSEELPESRRGS